MKCPHCNKTIKDDRIETAHMNAENYGSQFYSLDCLNCGKYYSFHISRFTKLDVLPEKTEQRISDF
jgi:uncharacterized protein with PIN domain